MRSVTWTSACILAAAFLGACGSGGDGPQVQQDATTTVTTAAAGAVDTGEAARAATSAATGATIPGRVVDFAFDPDDHAVEVGDTIIWTNTGDRTHTVTATSGAEFDSGRLSPGASFAWQARAAGGIQFRCDIHPERMRGGVSVDDPAAGGDATTTVAPPPKPPVTPRATIGAVSDEGSRLEVTYTATIPLQLPGGDHLHFFFDTVGAEEAGAPGRGTYFMTDKSTQYTIPESAVADATENAAAPPAALCVVVARSDHTVYEGSGNCLDLPGG